MIEEFVNFYSRLITERPFAFAVVTFFVAAVLLAGGTQVKTVEQNTEDFLPDTVPAIVAFETLEAEFPTAEGTSYTILYETSPNHANSNEIRDLRNPRFLRFSRDVANDLRKFDKIERVSTPSQLFKRIPPDKREVKTTLKTLSTSRVSQHISDDFEAARMRITAVGLTTDEEVEMANRIRETVRSHEKPPGIEVSYTGQTYIDEAFQRESRKTTSTTTAVAFAGVLVVVILLFRSLYYGITSTQTLFFGIAAGFGVFGYLGLNLSAATSGAISIGVGIAIDFGIQPVSRYREERQEKDVQEALYETIINIYRPMTLGLIGAILGFSALSTGRITFLSSLGTLLTLTTLMAYIAAFTVIPVSVVLYDKYLNRKINAILKTIKEV